jgi:Delta7-sterol 5-desaturase
MGSEAFAELLANPERAPIALLSIIFFFIALFRYLGFAGGLYWLFFVRNKDAWRERRIQSKEPDKARIRAEIRQGLATVLLFTGAFVASELAYRAGYTKMYADVDTYGWTYFWASIGLCMIFHDTYFYWTHRLMHIPFMLKHVHAFHHNTNPTPWTSFGASHIENLILVGVYPLMVCLFPLHQIAILIWVTIMNFTAAQAHLGHSFYPTRFIGTRTEKWLSRYVTCWLTTPTVHNEHHRKAATYFGFYFTVWDVLMGTDRPRVRAQDPQAESENVKTASVASHR